MLFTQIDSLPDGTTASDIFGFWATTKRWHPVQAGCLMCGFVPEIDLGPAFLLDTLGSDNQQLTKVREMLSALSLQLGDEIRKQWNQWSPAQWLGAFDEAGLGCVVPDELRQAVDEAVARKARRKKPEKPLHESERQTLLRLIKILAGMANLDLTKPYKAAEAVIAYAAGKIEVPHRDTIADKLEAAADN